MWHTSVETWEASNLKARGLKPNMPDGSHRATVRTPLPKVSLRKLEVEDEEFSWADVYCSTAYFRAPIKPPRMVPTCWAVRILSLGLCPLEVPA